MEGLATGSLLAYSSAHQIACCRSLNRIGFGNISLNQIGKYIDSARSWSAHLQALIDDAECRLFFPVSGISMRSISLLARFHDCKLRPPAAVSHDHNLQEITRCLNLARQEYREMKIRLSVQRYWIDTLSLPLTEVTLDHLYWIQQGSGPGNPTPRRNHSVRWLSGYLLNNASLETHLACGNIKKLTTLVEQAVRFAHCRRYQKAFGAEFIGIDSNWARLYADIRFFAEVQRVLRPSGIDQKILANWADYEAHFFSLCRKASTVRRRLHKLNRLVKRQYFTPAESTGYIALAHKSISRLQIWLRVLETTQCHGNLTPQHLLETLVTPRDQKLPSTTQNQTWQRTN